MKKKKGGGGGANWMDTYGDMVTLLLCFFVLLYSMSSISEDNWKALVMSFNPQAIRLDEPPALDIQGTDGMSSDPEDVGGDTPIPDIESDTTQEELDSMIEMLYEALQEYSQQEGMENVITVELDGGKVYVQFNETTFFEGDSYALLPEAEEVLTHVCEILDQTSSAIDEIRIQGHTAQANPDRPNNTTVDRFLASNRATNVLVFIQENSSIRPTRLVSEGMGQWRPISPNDTAEERALNRRVEMIISGRNLEQELLGNSLNSYIELIDNS
ncbi:MAG: flagellar motor protein MotB [Butyricicoccus sp.]|nr:flagellar motor protein MotB [Butyricicoccus sp.]